MIRRKPSCKGPHRDHPFGRKCQPFYYICSPPTYGRPTKHRCPPGTAWNGVDGWSDGACQWKELLGCK